MAARWFRAAPAGPRLSLRPGGERLLEVILAAVAMACVPPRVPPPAPSPGLAAEPGAAGAVLASTAAPSAPAPEAAEGSPPGFTLGPAHAEPDLVVDVRHRVERGETVYRIARTYGVTPAELMEANGIKDPRTLAAGQELVIPGVAEVVGQPAEEEEPEPAASPPGPKGKPPAPKQGSPPRVTPVARPAEPKAQPPAGRPVTVEPVAQPRPPGAKPPAPAPSETSPHAGKLRWPLRGVLYARFGKKGREPHDGIDLAAPLGTPVATAAEGTVFFAGEQPGYGHIVIVDHGHGLVTLYAHNRDLRVKTGQKVREGQVVATVGDSGRTSGPHLHFEVRREGVPVDPLDYLEVPPKPAASKGGRKR